MLDRKMSSYSWMMVACGFLILLVTNGMTLTGVTIFDKVLLAEFGWQRGALKLRDLITFAGAGLIAPLFGYFADKGHIKNCLLAGCGFLAAGFIAYSRVETLTGVYVAHALFGLALASAGIVSVVFLVSSHAPASRRGLALGLALVGSSFGNSVFPKLNLSLLKSLDWRSAFAALSLIPAILSLVIVATVRRSAPRVLEKNEVLPLSKDVQPAMKLASVLRTSTFWLIGGIAMLTFFAILGVTTHVFLRLTGAGYSIQTASDAIGLLFMMGLIGKLFSGAFADKFGHRSLMAISLLFMIVGAVGLSHFVLSNIYAWILSFGLGWGALYTLIQVSTVSSFGTNGAGRVLGAVAVLEALGGGLGPWLIGVTFDRTGSYDFGFMLIAGLLTVALVLSLFLPAAARARNLQSQVEAV